MPKVVRVAIPGHRLVVDFWGRLLLVHYLGARDDLLLGLLRLYPVVLIPLLLDDWWWWSLLFGLLVWFFARAPKTLHFKILFIIIRSSML